MFEITFNCSFSLYLIFSFFKSNFEARALKQCSYKKGVKGKGTLHQNYSRITASLPC